MANGTGTRISSIGSNLFRSPYFPTTTLSLKNLLLVPSLTKNLLSVSKFTRDNNCFFEFHPSYCCVKSQDSHKVLLQGALGEDGLYKLYPSLARTTSHNNSTHSSASVHNSLLSPKEIHHTVVSSSFNLWHQRLGHPNKDALEIVLNKCNIPFINKTNRDFCNSCSIAKSHKLPSSPSSTVYTAPLELVFFDVWGPSLVESSCGFLYFLTCVDAYSKFTWIYLLNHKFDVSNKFHLFKAMAEK